MLAGKCLVYIKHVWNEPQVEKCFNPLKPDVHYLVMNCYEQIGYCMQEWNSLQKNWTDLACPRPSPRKKQMPAGHFPKHSTAAWITPKPKPPPRIGTRGKEITNQVSPIRRTRKTPWKGIIPQPPICTRQRQYSVST